MKYILTKHIIGNREIIEITLEEYEQVKKAKESLFEALHIEEKLYMIIENFREFEMLLLDLTMKYAIYHDINWSVFNEEKNAINRKLANFLTASRIYFDQLIHHINNIYGPSSKYIDNIKDVIRKEYEAELGFRVMSALRNYVQHNGFAVHSITHNSGWDKDRTFMTDTIVPQIFLPELESDTKFKRTVLNEMRVLGNNIDIRPFIRTYVSSIAKIQEYVRGIIKDYSQSWEDSLNSVINKYPGYKNGGADIPSLVVAIMREDETYGDVIYLFREYIRRWKTLERVNSHVKYMPKRIVTNQ